MSDTLFKMSKSDTTGVSDNVPQVITSFLISHLSIPELKDICLQFQSGTWNSNSQVLWSGIPHDHAQRWAEKHEKQTLTAAMGPLMDASDPACVKSRKSAKAWSKYIKGASAVFAWHITQGEMITVLLPPPPHRFHPSGHTNYQAIEEPILRGVLGNRAVSRIDVVHPTVPGAEDFSYQLWPTDETSLWVTKFGVLEPKARFWRPISRNQGDNEIFDACRATEVSARLLVAQLSS